VCSFAIFYLGVTFNAMNESALDMLRKEAKGKKLERKTQAARKKEIEKAITSKVHRSDLHRAFNFTSTNRKGN
jgi:hypothetical protein